tara:strand:- start:4057 stop:4389 length:333 start_codon:yes stop_codon:yes gene_type:complete
VINSRNKGKRFELRIAEVWARVMGGDPQRTGYVSKWLDDQGVDLTDTDPFYLQCKAHERSLPMHDILDAMPDGENYNVVIHKRNNRGCIVALRFSDFLELAEMLRKNGVL